MRRVSDGRSPTDYAIILTMNDHRPDVDRIEKEARERFPGDSPNEKTSRNHYITKEFRKLCEEYDLFI